jgi:NADPH:quinone reductase-like Zn-dependent oxidoreductase
MKAAVYHTYGSPDVVTCEEVEKPTPDDDEVLIKVHAASANQFDLHLMKGKPFPLRFMTGLRKPKSTRPGRDVSGTVEAVGANAQQFTIGDEVFGFSSGAFAEFACTKESRLARKPANVSFEAAAATPMAAITALQGLRNAGRIQRSDKVLIDGASGGVGTFAVQIAKSFGAHVTAVCSTRHVATAGSLGADRVIDYTREDFTHGSECYDLIFAANAHHPILNYRRALTKDGRYVIGGGGWAEVLQGLMLGPLLSLVGTKKMLIASVRIKQEDLVYLGDLLGAEKLVPVIDRRFPLSGVAEALRYLDEGHAMGKVLITFGAA